MEDAGRLGLDGIWTGANLSAILFLLEVSHVWADWFSHYHAWDNTQFGFRLTHRTNFNILIVAHLVIRLTIVIEVGNLFLRILKRHTLIQEPNMKVLIIINNKLRTHISNMPFRFGIAAFLCYHMLTWFGGHRRNREGVGATFRRKQEDVGDLILGYVAVLVGVLRFVFQHADVQV